MLIRLISGIVFLLVIFVPFYLDVHYKLSTLNFVLLFFALASVLELYRMANQGKDKKKPVSLSLITCILIFLPVIAYGIYFNLYNFIPFRFSALKVISFWAFPVMLLFLPLFIGFIYLKKGTEKIFNYPFLLAFVYIIIPMFSLSLMYFLSSPFHKMYLLLILCGIFSNDTFAYLSGKYFGKHKLIPAVSPKKTWEGFIGGILGSMLVLLVVAFCMDGGNLNLTAVLITVVLAVLTSVLAVFGDLFESKLKRAAGVKDSGTLIPGHGGVLDRIDALVFTAPILFVLLNLLF